MSKKLQVISLFVMFLTIITLGCSDGDCPHCTGMNYRPDWLPDGSMRDPSLLIHAIRIWEPRHQYAFDEIYERNDMDFCVTMDSGTVPRIKYVVAELITSNHIVDQSFRLELWETEKLVGVYCQRVFVDESFSRDIVNYRATVVDWNWNFNQESKDVVFVPLEQ
jgi:hypothetical protein